MNSSIASRFNANLLDEKFALWRDNPRSVDSDWAAFFEGFSLGMAQIERDVKSLDSSAESSSSMPPAVARLKFKLKMKNSFLLCSEVRTFLFS